jgi:hypothetical protein
MTMNGKQSDNELYIGIDLGEKRALVSFYTAGMVEPETVTTRTSEEHYEIPTAICRTKNGKLFYGEEAVKRRAEEGAVFADHLLQQAVQLRTEEKLEDLTLFLKRLTAFRRSYARDMQEPFHLGIAVSHLNTETVSILLQIRDRLQIAPERFRMTDYRESFFDYTILQDRSIWKNDTVMFDFTDRQLTCYHLKIRGKRHPLRAQVHTSRWEVPELAMADRGERDRFFSARVEESFLGQNISGVYLIGDGFDGGWFDRTLEAFGPSKRIFIGKNLYTKGACLGAFRRLHDEGECIRFVCDYKIRRELCIRVSQERREVFLPIVTAGKNWFESSFSCCLLYNGSSEIRLYERETGHGPKLRQTLFLDDFPARKPKSVRLRFSAYPINAGQLLIRISDEGFGGFYPNTGKAWSYTVDLNEDNGNE